MGEVDYLSWASGKGQMWSIEIEKERDTERVVKRAEKVIEEEIWECGTQRSVITVGEGWDWRGRGR